MSTREIISLQVGHYSNFVGTHWWNLQESSFVYDPKILTQFPKEVNHDVLFREGLTQKGEVTYTPRLVMIDLNHSLGTLKKDGILYDDAGLEEDVKWLGDVTLHETPSAKKNKFLKDLEEEGEDDTEKSDPCEFQSSANNDRQEEIDTEKRNVPEKIEDQATVQRKYNLNSDVNVWSDFLRTGIHPKSIQILTEYHHNNPEQPFNIFGHGQQALTERGMWDAVEDKIRYFTEECDQLQGFHISVDNYNAFGGAGSFLMQYLADEYRNKSRMCFSVTPACPPDQTAAERSSRILNSALTLHHCSEHSSLYVPLSLASSLWKTVGQPVFMPYVDYQADIDYQTSAILAATLDTVTMPYRKWNDPARLTDITGSFSSLGRKVSAVSTSLPFPLSLNGTFVDTLLSQKQSELSTSLTPHVKCASTPSFQSCVVRGIPESMTKRDPSSKSTYTPLSSCSSLDDVLQLYLAESFQGSLNAGCVMRDGANVEAPYPNFFKANVNSNGFLTDTLRSSSCGVNTVPLMTSLQSSPDVHNYIDSLAEVVSKFNIEKHQHFIEAGLDSDSFSETVQELKALAQCYKQTP